jgi:hypothetical protein
MQNRRRLAAVLTPMFALLAALLLSAGVAMAQEPSGDAGAGPLSVTLTSSRDVCTANTLTELTWTITGGKPPYTLTIDGETVDPAAESHRINCGPLPDTPAPDPASPFPVEYRHARGFAATVTDARGVSVTGTDLAELVPPLPAPTGLGHVTAYGGRVQTLWSDVPGVGELTLESAKGTPYTLGAYLVRYRVVGAPDWIHALRETTVGNVWEVAAAGLREFSVAALRHPLERLTPAALRWSVAHAYASVVAPQNVVATATHDTVTVSWDKQPHGEDGVVWLSGAGGGVQQEFPMATSAGRHSVTFSDLPPSTTYGVFVEYPPPEGGKNFVQTEVTTLAPPPDYEPLPSGPQNLGATATHNSITVSWEASRPDDPQSYAVDVFHAESGFWIDEWDLPAGVTSVTVTGLFWRVEPDTLYEIIVYELGIPQVTAEVSIRTPAAPDAAAGAQGGAARYAVRWRPPDGIFAPNEAASGTRHVITGLSPGLPYVVRVHAISAAGATLRQYRGDFRTTLTAPPTLTVSAATATTLTVNWSAPTGWTPSGYLLSWRPVGGTPFDGSAQLAAGVRGHAITGLTDGTPYVIRLTALNAAGAESPPRRVTATATDVPCAVGIAVPNPAGNPALVKDCAALLAMKDTLRGTGALNWTYTLPIAQWDGVTVSGRPQRVTGLRLAARGLTGVLPSALGDLSALTRIDLTWNKLRGAIPTELGNLTELTDLALYRNRLSGGIPAELGTLAKLERLSLSQNFLSGSIPADLGNLAKLQSLYLYQNRLSGPIPPALGQLSALTDLYLSENSLTGCVPRELQQVTRNDLDQLGLDSCPLPSTTLSYGAPTTTGSVTDDGDYAFLTDPDDLTTMVTTYEGLRDGSTAGLVIHENDSAGASQADLYDLVQADDLFEWRQASDCFVRYTVTDVKDDPAGDPPRKLLAVAWMTYAFTGCSGAISSTATASLRWGPLPDLGGTSLTAPVVHGIYQIVPEDWSGATETGQVHDLPDGEPAIYPSHGVTTDDVTVARGFRYWREPTIPSAWTWSFAAAATGGYNVSQIGYCAGYVNAQGIGGIVICGDHAVGQRLPEQATWLARGGSAGERRQGVLETRVIAGRPALIQFSPPGLHHDPGASLAVWVYDAATQGAYTIRSGSGRMRGANIDPLITIVASLFEPPNAP